jgi:hypothetical protein
MNDEKPPETDRMEQLLRQWGAEEGARREGPAAPPAALMRAARPPAPLVRWLPVAAGFIFFAIGVGLFVTTVSRDAAMNDAIATDSAAAGRIRSDLARTSEELASARAAIERLKVDAKANADAAAKAAGMVAAKTSDAAAVKTPSAVATKSTDTAAVAASIARAKQEAFEAGRTAATAAAQVEIAALKKAVAEKQVLLDRVVAATSTAAAPGDARDARIAVMKTQLDALQAELAAGKEALRKAGESSQAAERDAGNKIKALEGEQAMAMALFQRVTAAARMKPDEAMRTLQKTVRDSQLIKRGTALRDTVPNEAIRRIFDTQEALLTQLDMLDPGNAGEFEAFVKRVRSTDVGAQITEALKTIDGDPAVRAWLIESQLLLSGVQRAG